VFSLDTWQEILETIRSNTLRTLLTAFAVAWGIFMLIILLGSGTGLSHGVEYQFRDDAINSIWVRSGQTSVPFKGLGPGRNVQFTNTDHDEVRDRVAGVEHITSRFWMRGTSFVITYRGKTSNYPVRCVHPDHQFLEKTIVVKGRYLNDLDVAEFRKVAVIGKMVQQELLEGREAIGEQLEINGIAFKIVGVFEDVGGEGEMSMIYLPISTAQRTFGGGNSVGMFMLTTGDATLPESERMAESIRAKLSDRHDFAPDDQRAVHISNNVEHFVRFQNLMGAIRAFVWVIGVGTLLAGIVGVSNVMMIAVRERTREFGIRKALGATPRSILGLVLQEAVLITAVAGYLGLVLGVATLEAFTRFLPASEYFRRPEVDLAVAVQATVLLVLAGAAAGFLPARRAAAIKPIDALRDE
jgi:putative ABC transport system permease protein